MNPEDVKWHKGVIANPNCTTIIMLVAVAPLHRAFGLRRLVASTYQSASGAGAKGMLELLAQTKSRSTSSRTSTSSSPTATRRRR